MVLSLPSELELLRARAEQFGETLNEGLEEREREGEFRASLWLRCAEEGFTGLVGEKTLGGQARTPLEVSACFEGLGRGCGDNGLLLSLHAHLWGAVTPIRRFASDELRGRLLPGLLDGKRIGAHAATEKRAGGDLLQIETQARRSPQGYRLNGSKCFVTNGPVADVFIVYARTRPGSRPDGISAFLVERGTPGLRLSEAKSTLGLRTAPIGEITLDDCLVPGANRLGGEGAGYLIFNECLQWERTFVAAGIVGAMDRLLEECRRHGKTDRFPVTDRLDRMETGIEAARLLHRKAAWTLHRRRDALLESSMAKTFAAETYVKNCQEALRLVGARGYSAPSSWEREIRDSLGSLLYSGTNDVLRLMIGRLVLSGRFPLSETSTERPAPGPTPISNARSRTVQFPPPP